MAAPSDRVQALKQESTAQGGDSADSSPFNAWEVIDETEDALSAAGLFIQKQGGPADESVGIWREGDQLVFQDAVAAGSLSSSRDFLLENEPPSPNNDYSITRSGGLVTKEEWKRGDTTLIKSIDYTRSGGVITQEVRKVFASDGTTVLAQLTVVYTRSGGVVASATRTRNI